MSGRRGLILLAVGIVVMLAAGLALWNPFAPQRAASPDAPTEAIVQQILEQRRASITETFLQSRRTPLREGETFPLLALPVLRGPTPDWSQPTVVTLGTANSSSAAELYAVLRDAPLQKIHILSGGVPDQADVTALPDDVIWLNGIDAAAADAFVISPRLSEPLGVYRATSAYLLGENRLILYAQPNRGGFDNVAQSARLLLAEGPTAVRPNPHAILQVGDALPLSALPPNLRPELQAELDKPLAVVFFVDEALCDICADWRARSRPFVQDWVSRGYGVVIVESGQGEYRLERSESGALVLQDVRPADQPTSALAEAWGIAGIPYTMVFQDGAYQGYVPYMEVEVEGVPYRDLHFQGVNEVFFNVLPRLSES